MPITTLLKDSAGSLLAQPLTSTTFRSSTMCILLIGALPLISGCLTGEPVADSQNAEDRHSSSGSSSETELVLTDAKETSPPKSTTDLVPEQGPTIVALTPLTEVTVNDSSLTATLISHGCTRSSDFVVEHNIKDGQCRISIVRMKPDNCLRKPLLVELDIAWVEQKQCGGAEPVITNPAIEVTQNKLPIKRLQ